MNASPSNINSYTIWKLWIAWIGSWIFSHFTLKNNTHQNHHFMIIENAFSYRFNFLFFFFFSNLKYMKTFCTCIRCILCSPNGIPYAVVSFIHYETVQAQDELIKYNEYWIHTSTIQWPIAVYAVCSVHHHPMSNVQCELFCRICLNIILYVV